MKIDIIENKKSKLVFEVGVAKKGKQKYYIYKPVREH